MTCPCNKKKLLTMVMTNTLTTSSQTEVGLSPGAQKFGTFGYGASQSSEGTSCTSCRCLLDLPDYSCHIRSCAKESHDRSTPKIKNQPARTRYTECPITSVVLIVSPLLLFCFPVSPVSFYFLRSNRRERKPFFASRPRLAKKEASRIWAFYH